MNGKNSPGTHAKDRMILSVPTTGPKKTIGQVQKQIIGNASVYESLDYIYVVDEQGILIGVLSIKELLRQERKDIIVEKVMTKNPVIAHPSTPQERLVYLALSHRIRAIPIVRKDGGFLGAVTHDTILQIFNSEVRDDALKFGGIFHKIGKEMATVTSPVMVMIKARLPWLIIGIIGGTIAATIVTGFENFLETYIALAAFIPVLVYMSDAAGTQSETLIVRSLAIDPKIRLGRYIVRELQIAFIIALVVSVLLGLVAILGWGSGLLGIIIGISMFASTIAAVLISTLLPLLFRRFGADPAVASGPFATMISDIATIMIYFMVATWMLGYSRPL